MRKLLCWGLTLAMCVSLFPAAALAADAAEEPAAPEALPSPVDETEEAASGQCGDNLFWTVENGTLTISGTGDMWDVPAYASPFAGDFSAVELLPGVTSIGANAFNGRSITSVTIPGSVTSIGVSAFYSCDGLTSVTMAEGLETIGADAFKYSGMTVFHLPGTITSLGDNALVSAEEIYFNGSVEQWRRARGSQSINPYFTVVYCLDGTIPAADTNRCGDDLTWTLDNGVLTISGTGDMWGAPYWLNNPGFRSVLINNGATSIGHDAFSYCNQIERIDLPGTLRRIDDLAFIGCSALKSITLPESLEELTSTALAGSCLTEIHFRGSAPILGAQCFGGITATVYYPAGDETWTEEIRQNYAGTITWAAEEPGEAQIVASGECGDDLTWTLDEEGKLTISGTGPMWGSDADVEFWQAYSLQIRSVVFEEGATTIRDNAFYSCRALNSVSLPGTLTEIGYFAFGDCASLEEILLPASVSTVQCNAFWGCTALQAIRVAEENEALASLDGILYDGTVETLLLFPAGKSGPLEIPGTVTTIREEACACSGVTRVTIPASVTTIEGNAFGGCGSMASIRFEGPAPSIAENAFSGVTATAAYPAGDESWTGEARQNYGGTLTWKSYGGAILGSGRCGDDACWSLDESGLLTISGTGPMWDYGRTDTDAPDWLREHAARIKYIQIEDGITYVGANAFFVGFYSYEAELIGFPESLTAIGDYAFWQTQCSVFVLPEGLREIGEGAFGLSCLQGTLTIPATVEKIGGSAFRGCFIQRLILEDGVREIGDEAFSDCAELTVASIPASVTAIGSKALAEGCRNLKDVWYDGTRAQWVQIAQADSVERQITTVHCTDGDHTPASLNQCGDDLTWSISWINNVQTLTISGTGDMWDFWYLTVPWQQYLCSLQRVVLEEGVTSVGKFAFSRAESLTEVVLPGSLTSIGNGAFSGCSGLGSITLPVQVRSVGISNFCTCRSMTEILVDPDNEYFCSIGGALYSKDGSALIEYPGGRAGEFVVPANTTEIAASALAGAEAVTEVTLPAQMVKIGDKAFEKCSGLNTIRFSGNAPLFGEEVFGEVTATAYYPADDPTWTEEIVGDESFGGGTITWVAYASPAYTPGDINGDGDVDNKDVTWLMRYVKYQDVSVTAPALDVNGDGEVDNRDVTWLMRYVKYQDVTIH